MPKEKSPEQVYDELVTQGLYEEAHLDKKEVEKVILLVTEDYEFGKRLKKLDTPSWRVIFTIHYDVIRQLCDQLMRFEKQKIGNHQGLFAFIIIHFPDLDLDWKFFETIRRLRNQNKYLGIDIAKETWKKIELQMDLYISTLKAEIENRLKLM